MDVTYEGVLKVCPGAVTKLQGDKKMNRIRQNQITCVIFLLALTTSSNGQDESTNQAPIADAGLPRYAATDPVQLDGTGSYDPDNSGALVYEWQQVTGLPLIIVDANTATPTIGGSMEPGTGRDPEPKIGGFSQTDEVQECEFELIVNDGELTSVPDTVRVVIVPKFASGTVQLQNPPFDANKPTIIYINGGATCESGGGAFWGDSEWDRKTNTIACSCGPDASYEDYRTFYQLGDRIIVYLSSVAPEYHQPIQTIGWSFGGQPAVDVGIRLNRIYQDARYAVNRVTQLDAPCRYRDHGKELYYEVAQLYLTSSVDGEQCWSDVYFGPDLGTEILPNGLSVCLGLNHEKVRDWYRNSLTSSDANLFNNGVVGGAYWSVIGPGKNLQLATFSDEYFYFAWTGDSTNGQMRLYDEARYPVRLPEPVTLVEPVLVEDSNGVILTCEESENAVGYELLCGNNPYRIMDYDILSDTPTPPNDVVTLPYEEGWWTVRVRDQYGSTIYADPKQISTIAYNLNPVDDASHPDTMVKLSWSAGIFAASHDVYFGENFDAVNAGDPGVFQGNQVGTFSIIGLPGYPYPNGLIPDTTYYWRVDDVEANGTKIHKGNIWSFTVAPKTNDDFTLVDSARLLSESLQ